MVRGIASGQVIIPFLQMQEYRFGVSRINRIERALFNNQIGYRGYAAELSILERNSAVFLWSQYSAMKALQIKKIGEMTSDDSKRRYLMGGSRYVPDNFGSRWRRPVIVVSSNKANTYSSVITVVPLTSRIYKKRYLPTHVFISKYDMTGIRKGSLALAEQVMSISTKCIIEKCGRVNKWSLDRVLKAVRIQMGMNASEK